MLVLRQAGLKRPASRAFPADDWIGLSGLGLTVAGRAGRGLQCATIGSLTSAMIEVTGAAFRGSEPSRYSRRATMARAPVGTGIVKRSRRDSIGLILVSLPTDTALKKRSATFSRTTPFSSFSSRRYTLSCR